jgi:hypothetical protein
MQLNADSDLIVALLERKYEVSLYFFFAFAGIVSVLWGLLVPDLNFLIA